MRRENEKESDLMNCPRAVVASALAVALCPVGMASAQNIAVFADQPAYLVEAGAGHTTSVTIQSSGGFGASFAMSGFWIDIIADDIGIEVTSFAINPALEAFNTSGSVSGANIFSVDGGQLYIPNIIDADDNSQPITLMTIEYTTTADFDGEVNFTIQRSASIDPTFGAGASWYSPDGSISGDYETSTPAGLTDVPVDYSGFRIIVPAAPSLAVLVAAPMVTRRRRR